MERRVELKWGENQPSSKDSMRWDKAKELVNIVQIYGEDRGQFDPVMSLYTRPKNYYFPNSSERN